MNIRMNCFFKLIIAIIWMYCVNHEGKYKVRSKGFNVLSGEGSLIVFGFILCLFTSCALLSMHENPKPCTGAC